MMSRPALSEPKEPEFTTLPRVARAKGIGVRQLRRAVRAGELTVFGIGKWPRVRESDVDSWIERQRVQSS